MSIVCSTQCARMHIPCETTLKYFILSFSLLFLENINHPVITSWCLSPAFRTLAIHKKLIEAEKTHPVCCLHMVAHDRWNKAGKTALQRSLQWVNISLPIIHHRLCCYPPKMPQNMRCLLFHKSSSPCDWAFFLFLHCRLALWLCTLCVPWPFPRGKILPLSLVDRKWQRPSLWTVAYERFDDLRKCTLLTSVSHSWEWFVLHDVTSDPLPLC